MTLPTLIEWRQSGFNWYEIVALVRLNSTSGRPYFQFRVTLRNNVAYYPCERDSNQRPHGLIVTVPLSFCAA
jgi:hypothetical protein